MCFDTCLSLVILGSKVNVYKLSLCILKKVQAELPMPCVSLLEISTCSHYKKYSGALRHGFA